MSLQVLWSFYQSHPSQVVNALALLLALAGSWLLLATRLREQRAASRLLLDGESLEMSGEGVDDDAPVSRINRFFYGFGGASLLAAVGLSWLSTGLHVVL